MCTMRTSAAPPGGAAGDCASSGERAPRSSLPSGSLARASASARPIPRLAPVISAVFPVSSTARCTGGL